MPKRSLTELTVKNLKPPGTGQETTWDTQLTGFGLRCSQGGAKTFIVMFGKTRKRVSIGRYPTVSLAAARQRAKEILSAATLHPNKAPSPPFDEAIDRYLKLRQPELRPSTYIEYKRLLRSHFPFGDTLVEDISTNEAADTIDKIERLSERAHAYVALKVFFNWCLEREYCTKNPLALIRKPKVPSAKERVLGDDEVTAIWKATDQLGKYGVIVRLLLVTGQRREQTARLRADWIDEKRKVISFPAEIMKNKRDHALPYGALTGFLLKTVIPVEGYYFSPEGLVGHPFSAWSKNKKRLDALLPDMDPWTLHDLRRTWSTNAARLDVPPHITDRVLSHVTGSLSVVHRIYNRWLSDISTRASAALLRLCIQKLCKQVGEKGENINDDIRSLVSKGLDARVQKTLDVIRVIGNNAVHPGTIDLKDDRETAAKLFELVNRIAYDMITHPKELNALYDEKLSDGVKDAIERRDNKDKANPPKE